MFDSYFWKGERQKKLIILKGMRNIPKDIRNICHYILGLLF